jgi:hypothetical protein
MWIGGPTASRMFPVNSPAVATIVIAPYLRHTAVRRTCAVIGVAILPSAARPTAPPRSRRPPTPLSTASQARRRTVRPSARRRPADLPRRSPLPHRPRRSPVPLPLQTCVASVQPPRPPVPLPLQTCVASVQPPRPRRNRSVPPLHPGCPAWTLDAVYRPHRPRGAPARRASAIQAAQSDMSIQTYCLIKLSQPQTSQSRESTARRPLMLPRRRTALPSARTGEVAPRGLRWAQAAPGGGWAAACFLPAGGGVV